MPDPGQSEALEKILGRNSGPTGKEPMKMGLTEAEQVGERGQVRLFGIMLVEIPDYPGNSIVVTHAFRCGVPGYGFHAFRIAESAGRLHPIVAVISGLREGDCFWVK